MTSRILAGLAIGIAILASTSLQAREVTTPRAAMRAIVAAGYSGVGGVTRSGSRYIAVAISPQGKRVRVTLDGETGEIARVVPARRGAGSLTPQERTVRSFEPQTIDAPTHPLMFDPYVPPSDTKPIGAPNFPFSGPGFSSTPTCRANPALLGC